MTGFSAGISEAGRVSPEDVEFCATDESGPIALADLFPRFAPLEVDLGSGAGSFLIALAAAFPERNFLGVERLLHRVRRTCRGAARADLRNVRVLRREIADAVHSRLPAESVAVFHLLFPDPWPKRRHHPRRLINDFFLRAAWSALEKEGELWVMTDDRDYFEQARKLAASHPFQEAAWLERPGYPRTDFERRFTAEGRAVCRLRLRKVTP